ncbi:MAG TPA: hypothetical protein VEQ58_07580, partial [Polyangiaceae bacterium]|nr:hypothetical protein [Polyangiaceae bacterium]
MRANDDAIGYKNLSMRLSRFCIRLTLAAVSLTLGHACVETGEGVGSDESAGQPSEGGDGQVAGSSGATIRGGTKNYDAGSGGVGDSSGTADIAGQGLGGQLQLGGGGQPDVAGNGGAGAESAGGAPGTTWPGCSTAIYCDDFESYDVLGQPWTVSTLNGVVGIDTARHASGSKSVKFSTSVGEDDARQAAISYTAAFPLERNELYGRVRVFSASVTDEIATKWYLVKAGGAGGTTRLGGQAETLESSFHGNTTECWSQSQTPMPLNEWACL